MPRHGRSDPRVQRITERLTTLLLRFGSLNALAEGLSEAGGEAAVRVYPHRLQALLSNDPSRGINTATLEMLENSCARVAEPDGWAVDPDAVRAAVAALSLAQGLDAAVGRAADDFGIPAGVVRVVIGPASPSPAPLTASPPPSLPDWSWQRAAIDSSLAGMREGATAKVGLILPTGAGKTRVALQVALASLNEHPGQILWFTHRRHLEKQARRTLQVLVRETGMSAEDAAKTFERLRFVMTTRAAEAIREAGDELIGVIVDEAHHAAATSYQPILDLDTAPALLLTATPNRADALPIGINSVAYEITYRELFERGCLIEPVFDPPEELPGLDWASPAGLYPLADYLLDRAETDFAKPLVAVSQRERAELLHQAILDRLDARGSHPLTADDVGYVHGGSNSRGLEDASDFLDEFGALPSGILIATSQLVGEGFDDPSLDAAVLTYPSTSISHLMQVAGRALRWAPGKKSAHVVQVRQSALEYHFEQRWLYQDISDQLRPQLLDFNYSSTTELLEKITKVLSDHQVADGTKDEILAQLAAQPGRSVRIMLSGKPYFGAADAFEKHGTWGAILVTPTERPRFLSIFNDISVRTEDLKEQYRYLKAKFLPGPPPSNLLRSYSELIPAMEYARREITGVSYSGAANRPYRAGRATTWLKYVTFTFRPVVPDALDQLFADSYNRDSLLKEYTEAPEAWGLALRLELPVIGSEGFLLSHEQAAWFMAQQSDLLARLAEVPRSSVLDELGRWKNQLGGTSLPHRLISNITQFLRPERAIAHQLLLQYGGTSTPP